MNATSKIFSFPFVLLTQNPFLNSRYNNWHEKDHAQDENPDHPTYSSHYAIRISINQGHAEKEEGDY